MVTEPLTQADLTVISELALGPGQMCSDARRLIAEVKELRAARDRVEGALDLADREVRLGVATVKEANAEIYRLNLEVHWIECPLPPDAGCEPCHERTRMRALHPEHRWTEGELRGTFEVRDAENERFRVLGERLR